MQKPKATSGLRHVALFCQNFEASVHFYTVLLGLQITWQPDADNIYLTSGSDNFALHRVASTVAFTQPQRLDHIGFLLAEIEQVDVWYAYLVAHAVPLKIKPRTHRDGARSFYCLDPDGVTVQMIYIPNLKILS